MMKKLILFVFAVMIVFTLTACDNNTPEQNSTESTQEEFSYSQVSAQEAKNIMESEENYVILDVRTQEEFVEKHIPGAILIPDYEIAQKAPSVLTDKSELILVYCRSGRRSKLASQELVDMGYTNIVEFGGIIDWPFETESDLI